MSIQGKKAKGSRAEREFATLLREAGLDETARRMVLSGSILGLESDIFTKLPFMFEIKNHERVRLWEFWEQARSQAVGTHRKPVLALKSNFRDFLVVMDVQDWLELVSYALDKVEGKYE